MPSSYSSSNNHPVSTAPSTEVIHRARQITSTFTSATIHKAAWALLPARRTQESGPHIVFGESSTAEASPWTASRTFLGPCVTNIPVRVRPYKPTSLSRTSFNKSKPNTHSLWSMTLSTCATVRHCDALHLLAGRHVTLVVLCNTMTANPFAGELAHFETRVFNAVPRMPHIVSTPKGDGGLGIMLWADSREVSGEMADELLREFGEGL
ncbi:hypothetical protein CFD26_106288 [Aspergillus turcosus]|uniref:Uncharacterized protein n=1 Tax=Aspergillus turcosus TaxID=1245748 RepID=A0A3R7FQZ7_9EURO|nr:hypothetical protein CFD26_106288 [Aspergillus turcosus]